ncbi:3'-5' exonuclease [uncultured Acetobacterium sp.]|uniref:ATP-dependent helicase n=1 Tax=uncultured Acetobacterium sp. TaxID=217139 RepID=UPI0025E5377E|nr:3'-5' exonuclease [uncultured Acetobacterium sp.]
MASNSPTPQQQSIIQATEGYVRVPAVPGSGKTYCLTHRVAHLIQDLYIAPDVIIALTFTRKAASGMKRKLRGLIGDVATCFMGTFHHYCSNILKEEIHHLGYPKLFKSLRRSDQNKFVREILKEMNLSARDYRERDVLEKIREFKVNGSYVELFEQEPKTQILEQCIQKADSAHHIMDGIIYRYLLKEFQVHALDYDDLLYFTVHIFKKYADVLDKWQDKCEYVLIDEYQDVSKVQAELADMISQKYKNLFIIGDDDQLIYSWRGSKPEYLIEFDKKYPNTQTFTLNCNFRSTPEIIKAADALIQHNTERLPKQMKTSNATGSLPVYNCTKTAVDEAIWIADKIHESVEAGCEYKEIAILIRNSSQASHIEQQLRLHAIPYKAYAGAKFFESEEIRTVLSYLSMILFLDDLSFEQTVNMPKRGFGKSSMEKVKQYAADNQLTLFTALMTLVQAGEIKNKQIFEYCRHIYTMNKSHQGYSCLELANIILDWGYRETLDGDPDQEKKDNITALLQMINELEKEEDGPIPLHDLLQFFALFSPEDDENDDDKVKIMTIHTAKGLEFDHVFIPGMVEGILPSGRAVTKQAIEEERRVCYVAVTRAVKQLFLSSYQYQYEKQSSPSMSSRFINEMGENNLMMLQKPVESLAVNSPQKPSSYCTPQFVIAQRVSVGLWGEGTIMEVDEQKQKYKILFDAMPNLAKNIAFAADIKIL